MPMTIACPSCSQPLTFGEEWAGRPVKCPYCDAMLDLPASPAASLTQARRGSLSGGGERTPDEPTRKNRKGALLLALIVGALVLLLICGGFGIGGYLIWFGVNSSPR